jgi:MFS family permease
MPRNIPLFIAFRLLFNARFYYPIFAIIQLDYGLTMAQFAILNAVWAVSIVLLEVPSGALADRIGRKRMVVGASILMVIEMAIIAFIPFGNPSIVFWAWVINRILSGAAEASASGADEALAYDSIPLDQQKTRWPKVLARLMTLSSVAFVFAMLIGAAVYDTNLVNKALGWFGSDLELKKETVIRFPIYLTLFTGCCAVVVSLLMKEPQTEEDDTCPVDPSAPDREYSMWSDIFSAGRWILQTPFVFVIILAALAHDTVVRIFLTSSSEYYRLIDIPVALFGVIGATFAAIGIFVPKIAQKMVEKNSIQKNYLAVSIVTLLGLVGISLAIPLWGVGMVLFFGIGFGMLNFFTSHYLNAEVSSRRRATVLSFKGLALNLGFGAISLLYGGILRFLRDGAEPIPGASDSAFRESLFWLPGIFLILLGGLWLYYFRKARSSMPTDR